MTMNDEQKRLIAAVVFSSLILMTWQYFFPPKPIDVPSNIVASQTTTSSNNTTQNSISSAPSSTQQAMVEHKNYEIPLGFNKNEMDKIVFNESFQINQFITKNAHKSFQDTLGGETMGLALVQSGGRIVYPMFHMEQKQANVWQGVDSQQNINLTLWATQEGFLKFKLTSATPMKYQFHFPSRSLEKSSRSKREFVIYNQKKVLRYPVGDEFQDEGGLKWFGIDFDYHLLSYVIDTPTAFFTFKGDKSNQMTVAMTGALEELSGEIIYTVKNYDALKLLGSNLHLAVDFGIFGILAVPILKGLQFFYHFIPNYGISILILTLILRLVTFPLQLNSMKSMKKMQKIQPQLTALRERYKDDAQRMNLETMALFKSAKVNPLGGCLPILLQMPIFIAFYQVLSCAVELVHAPFFGHIKDLSIKDPYYIFPILMTLVMFIQQKMTPSASNMDPTQQKMMQFMPLVFGFVMIEMPAGLTLYMFFSTLLGIGQQMIVNKYT